MNELVFIDKQFSLKDMENLGTVTIHVQKTDHARAYQSSAIIMNFYELKHDYFRCKNFKNAA